MRKVKGNIAKAIELKKLRRQMAELRRQEKELSQFFKSKLDTGEVFEVDGVTVSVIEAVTVTIDRDALYEELGDKAKKFEKIKPHIKLKVS